MNCHQSRMEKLRAYMKEKYIFSAYITSPENVFYLSGFTGFGDAALFLTRNSSYLITDARYTLQAGHQCPEYQLITANAQDVRSIRELITAEQIGVVGFENEHILYCVYQSLHEEYPDVSFVPLGSYFTGSRDVKDETELHNIETACAIAAKSLQEVLPLIQPGAAERDVAAELEYRMRKNGASDKSFDTIVASGARSAMPHGVASDKIIAHGDPVTIDFGCIYRGYCSDMTRTFFVGAPSSQLKEIYEAVYEAQTAAIERFQYGMTGAELDNISREIIRQRGYGPNFGHSLGHGVGIEIHEAPAVSGRNQEPLQNHMVFSIEPGIYVEGTGGVRIEDLVVLQEGALRNLTGQFDKKMLVL